MLNVFLPVALGAPKWQARKVTAGEFSSLPSPEMPTADWAPGAVSIAFNQDPTKYQYTTYSVEKAIGNGPYFRVNAAPLVYFENEENPDTRLYFQDSLRDNLTEHHYRIVGRSPFGVDGPPSQQVSGFGLPTALTFAPRLVTLQVSPAAKKPSLLLEWSLPPEAEGQIIGFQLYRSRGGQNDALEKLHERILPAGRRSFTDFEPINGYFYYVALIDENGHEVYSEPALLVLLDHDPPEPPSGLSGAIDTNGFVRLSWQANQDPDHAAYRVYRSNQRSGHYFQITSRATSAEQFRDTVTMLTLTDTVFYAIKAVDFAGNYSELSSVAALARPDLTPPAAARIIGVEGKKDGVELEWSASPSRDVAVYLLERRPANNDTAGFRQVYQQNFGPFKYFDRSTSRGKSYEYRITVIDRSGYQTSGKAVTANHLDDGRRTQLTEVAAEQNGELKEVMLRFACVGPGKPLTFQLLRSKNDGPLLTLRTLRLSDPELIHAGNQNYQYLDKNLRHGDRLVYRIMARYADGGFTPLTEELEVLIE